MKKANLRRLAWGVFAVLFCLSCAKKPELPKTALNNDDCMLALKEKLEVNNCLHLQYATQDYTDILLRCHRSDSERKNMWDTNWFRISPSDIQYLEPEADYFVKEHTICIDGTWRIESYPPEYTNKQ